MIVGVDIGTSVTKAALLSHDGMVGRRSQRASRIHRHADGRVEQDLEEVLASVASVVREVTDGLDETIEAVAITGQGDGLWLRDSAGRAVRPPISWMDARASQRVGEWGAAGPDGIVSRLYRATGSAVFPGSHAALLCHLAEHEPESLERAAVAGYCVDAVVQRLTGRITVDASDASLPFLDVTRRQYVDEAFDLLGISRWRHLLPEPAAPHTLFPLDASGAALLGLPTGTPVSAGPYDLEACAFGAGTLLPGEGTLVVGTTLACEVLTASTERSAEEEPAGMWLCTPDPDLYLRVMPSMVGTASIDWLMSLFGLTANEVGSMLDATPPGASGVRALSFLSPSGERAPFVDPAARGQITGLDLTVGRAELVRALCESIAFLSRHCFETMGLSQDLALCGGGIRSRAWAQVFADVIGTPVHLPHDDMVGARGAALVAWDALDRPVDRELWRGQRETLQPRADLALLYDDGYRRYRDDLASARPSWSSQ